MKITLITLVLLAVCSCQPRQSTKEAELFLQQINQQLSHNSRDSLRKQLIEAEFKYHFTLEQQVRLKALLLYHFHANSKISDDFIAEAEAQALRLGNDSLLTLIREKTFIHYTLMQDTAQALRLLRLEEPRLLAHNWTKELNIYYVGLAVLYSRLNKTDQAIYWHRQTRRMNEQNEARLALWYSMMSQYLLNAGYNDDALHYADSCLCLPQKPYAVAINAYIIKGRILAIEGRIPEALSFYATALQDMKTSRPQVDSYSNSECRILYAYAELLHQAGRNREAIPLLEKMLHRKDPVGYIQQMIPVTASTGEQTNHLYPQKLLAKCHLSLGQKAKATYYTYLADSLQRSYAANTLQNKNHQIQADNSNLFLTHRLSLKEQEMDHARLTQYILWSAIAFLLALITSGLLWWHHHRRRLRQLFNELMRRHAEWTQIRMLLAESAGEAIFSDKQSPFFLPLPSSEKTSATTQTYCRHYLSALRIMEEQRPYTDPAFDLIALSRLVGTNRTQLSTAINQQAHTSFSNWLAEYRINYLISLVNLHPDTPIDELYPYAGFTSRSTFYRQFRQITGLTPKQYLKIASV